MRIKSVGALGRGVLGTGQHQVLTGWSTGYMDLDVRS